MKDILLVNMFSKNESSYTDYYIEELEKAGVSYESIYFERYDMNAEAEEGEILFKEYCPTGGSKFKKIGIMLRYAYLVRKLIRERQYKGIMVFTTVPAVMIQDLLTGRYTGKYLFDIRDYTHENIKAYKDIEDKLISHSFATIISSRGFLRFLPENRKYYVTHNVAMVDPDEYDARTIDPQNVHVGYVGSIRYYDENKAMISQFAGKPNYHMDYYGTLTQGYDLPGFCKEINADNVTFFGRYDNNDKKKIYRSIDVIHSAYGTQGLETTTLIPHRLYDAALYKCPIIVSKGTYLAEVVEKYQMGFAVDVFNDSVSEMLDAYLETYDPAEFTRHCNDFLNDVYKDMEIQKNVIRSFISSVCSK